MRKARVRRPNLRAVLLAAVLLLALWGLGDLAFVSIGAETDHAAQADVIIVLGCNVYQSNGPSPCIRARAGHAADLYRQGLAPRVIATGGPTEQGPVESAVLARVLTERGVPSGDIIQEEHALNTIQNIRNSQAIMREHGWSTAILVTEPFHINRAALIARDFGLAVYPSPALDTPNWDQPAVRVFNLSRDAVSLMLYQAKSLVGIRE
jgi:uncharacterized SAM-binding protein YcdF (DUF218 family)